MGRLLQTDFRYSVLMHLPKNNNGVVNFNSAAAKYMLTVLQIDDFHVRVLYKYYKNMLGETCVTFHEFVL
jgi:hypothetical protein